MVKRANPPVAVDRYPDRHERAIAVAAMQLDAQTVTDSDCTWYLREKWSPATAMLRLVQSLESVSIPSACKRHNFLCISFSDISKGWLQSGTIYFFFLNDKGDIQRYIQNFGDNFEMTHQLMMLKNENLLRCRYLEKFSELYAYG